MATRLSALRFSVRTRLMEELALMPPGAPLVSPQGALGASTYQYRIVARNDVGTSQGSALRTITTGAATLTVDDANLLTWTPVPQAGSYDVYRVYTDGIAPISLGMIGTTVLPTFLDSGQVGNESIAPVVNSSGILDPFWNDDELMQILIAGCKDLWRAIVDLHQGHFTIIDDQNVSLDAGQGQLTGIPVDCFRVLAIEARDLSAGSGVRHVMFAARSAKSQAFTAARSSASNDPSQASLIYYDILNAGSPVSAPLIVVAPRITGSIPLRLIYTQTLSPTLNEEDLNPIPGESDNALIAWGVAYARAKEREDRSPDPGHLAVYATDKQALLTALTPRQEQEPDTVEGMFEGHW